MSCRKRSCPRCLSHLSHNECLNILILYIVRLFYKDVRLNLYTITVSFSNFYMHFVYKQVHKNHVSPLCYRASNALILKSGSRDRSVPPSWFFGIFAADFEIFALVKEA